MSASKSTQSNSNVTEKVDENLVNNEKTKMRSEGNKVSCNDHPLIKCFDFNSTTTTAINNISDNNHSDNNHSDNNHSDNNHSDNNHSDNNHSDNTAKLNQNNPNSKKQRVTFMPSSLSESQSSQQACTWKLWSTIKVPTQLDSIHFCCALKDQGWGNMKGTLELKLCRGLKTNHPENNEWAADGSGDFSHVLHRCTLARADHQMRETTFALDHHSPIVQTAQQGDYFELHYKVGGGGGHKLFVNDPEFTMTLKGENQISKNVKEFEKDKVKNVLESESQENGSITLKSIESQLEFFSEDYPEFYPNQKEEEIL